MPDTNQIAPKRPPDIVLPMGQPLPLPPGPVFWLRLMMSRK
jgi:hypothetical protein